MPKARRHRQRHPLDDPQWLATWWLEGWVWSHYVGLPDPLTYSQVVEHHGATGQDDRLTFSQLQWQPILTAQPLARLVRKSAGSTLSAGRSAVRLLSDALSYLARDFESLLVARRSDASSLVMLRCFVRAVRGAATLLTGDYWNGGIHPREAVSGWGSLVPVAIWRCMRVLRRAPTRRKCLLRRTCARVSLRLMPTSSS
jgi:hypothetical protein